ncbi:hypothetical protein [Noviherbaspirillum suwonense]|uniref:Uncharacterized protein n=1 Tax=Noviherbaspirillum suwonense TaxID=1224511 RepID=A0ABY1Q323_9BURK|nr:hypothetical protein [Noviherbaspirillum suwonense]SMP57752.1 hypothetical protein SAMN06295970_105155 [Noviherbaspirillum suwonense]
MQFKEQGSKVQVLLYAGFDEAKNAPVVRIVGSFDKYTYKFSPGLLDKLNVEQRDELDAECQRRRQAALALNRQHYINALAANMRGACDSLDNNAALTPQQSDEIWDAMADLVRAMREAGYPRPTRDRKPGADAGQASLFD